MKIIHDEEIEKLDIRKVEDLSLLLVKYLCGEKYPYPLQKETKELISKIIIGNLRKDISYPQLNEILLLLSQDRMGEGFFAYFFNDKNVDLEGIKQGIKTFRCFAMLRYANFKFAYRTLRLQSKEDIKNLLFPFSDDTRLRKNNYVNRPNYILDINKINKEETFLLGEITFPRLGYELNKITSIRNEKTRFTDDDLNLYEKQILEFRDWIYPEVQKKGLQNTEVYLTWDYMDIYIATSMRNKWEFEETYDFINEVFSDSGSNCLAKLNLRYFDPTQSKCTNSRDKGLLEGLMLKRVGCTIYMVQENDTFGKDSELANSLAQSNPVIAYVPQYSFEEYAKKIESYPLEYFIKRLMLWKADGVFKDRFYKEKFESISINYMEIIDNFLDSAYGNIKTEEIEIRNVINHLAKNDEVIRKLFQSKKGIISDIDEKINAYLSLYQPELTDNDDIFAFSYWFEKESEFKNSYSRFTDLCKVLAIAECLNFDKRAETLKWRHPLSVQIDINTGVANGLFVVRTANECIDLLSRILLNDLEFDIEHVKMFGIDEKKFRTLCELSPVVSKHWLYDSEIKAVYQTSDLTEDESAQLEELRNDDSCIGEKKALVQELANYLDRFAIEGATVLKEKISQSPYRLITDNDKLSNSFWNLYY